MPEFSDDQITELYERDMEQEPAPFAFGAKFMTGACFRITRHSQKCSPTGGAGEGYQVLEPEGQFVFRQHVKSDQALPSYCLPPNPCPMGFTGRFVCVEYVQKTFSYHVKNSSKLCTIIRPPMMT